MAAAPLGAAKTACQREGGRAGLTRDERSLPTSGRGLGPPPGGDRLKEGGTASTVARPGAGRRGPGALAAQGRRCRSSSSALRRAQEGRWGRRRRIGPVLRGSRPERDDGAGADENVHGSG